MHCCNKRNGSSAARCCTEQERLATNFPLLALVCCQICLPCLARGLLGCRSRVRFFESVTRHSRCSEEPLSQSQDKISASELFQCVLFACFLCSFFLLCISSQKWQDCSVPVGVGFRRGSLALKLEKPKNPSKLCLKAWSFPCEGQVALLCSKTTCP